jgi:hypothetical protein
MKLFSLFVVLLVSLSSEAQRGNHSDTNRYENGGIRDILTYKKNILVNHVAFDEQGKLIYQSPLLQGQKKPTYRLASGRSYFDSKNLDTLILNNNIPSLNLNVYFPGATFIKIDPYSYYIKSWKPQPNSNKGKMVIDIYENAFFKSKWVYHKVELIEIK